MAVDRSRRGRATRKRKKRMAKVEHDLSAEQWAALKEAWGGCAYCGNTERPLQKDCVLALSRGGRYTLENIAPACGSCNASKSGDEVTGWLRRKKLDERAFLLRRAELMPPLLLRFPPEPPAADPPPAAAPAPKRRAPAAAPGSKRHRPATAPVSEASAKDAPAKD